jgi:hypothetical protein
MLDDPDFTDGDPYHDAHYQFAFGTIPDVVFGPDGAVFVKRLLSPQGQYIVSQLWGVMNERILAQPGDFEVRQRTMPDGGVQTVFRMPEVATSPEAHFVGFHIPPKVAAAIVAEDLPRLDLGAGDLRIVFLQEAEFGLTEVGEAEGRGVHRVLGDGPEPTWDGMWQVMRSLESGEL